MKYKFNIWYKSNKKSLQHLDVVEVEALSYKDALDEVAQIATNRTQITDER
jgi:hypothetical protein